MRIPKFFDDIRDKRFINGIKNIGKKKKHANTPFSTETHKRTLHKNLEFTATEQYKLLRANLEFTVPEGTKCPVIGVTSSMRGEGKSTTAVNLSYVLAEKGSKVLLIDGDLRIPSIAKKMDIPIIGLVENMSYLECPDCGKKISVFGESHIEEVAEQHGLKVLAQMPIRPQMAGHVDEGTVEYIEADFLKNAADMVEKL